MVIKTKDMILKGTIACKNGSVFQITNGPFDTDFKKDVEHYIKQGCIIEITLDAKFTKCGCDHCQQLTHIYD